MVELTPTAEQIAEAKKDAASMGVLPGSFMRGAGNTAGMLGEVVVSEWLKGTRTRPPVYSHDMVLRRATYDVKTKTAQFEPLPEYMASVSARSGEITVKAARLIFTRVTPDYSRMWLCGWITTEEFLKRATFIKKGTREGAFMHRIDGFHLKYSDLYDMESLKPASTSRKRARV